MIDTITEIMTLAGMFGLLSLAFGFVALVTQGFNYERLADVCIVIAAIGVVVMILLSVAALGVGMAHEL